jgi:serine/threonine protein kinase
MLVFGRVRPLGFGAESTVFPAAIKIKNDPGDAKREYTMHRMCASAYVVPVEYLEIARAIVMPAATMDLFAFLESNATIEPGELWRIVRHMSAAVAAVHRACVVHRDVKLENFMCFEEPCGESDESGDEEADDEEEGEAEESDRRKQGEADEADRMEEGEAGEAGESDDEEEEEAPEEEPQKAPEEADRREEDRREEDRREEDRREEDRREEDRREADRREADRREEDRREEDRRNQGEEPKEPKAPKAPNAVRPNAVRPNAVRPNAVRQISSTRMVVKLTDFGFATKLEEGTKLTATQGTRVGSIPYVAPEIVAFAPYDAKADVWSLGVCVFMLLTKCAPFDPPNYGTLSKGAQKRWSGRSKVLTEPQRAVVARSLVVDQDKRASSRAISRATIRCI